MNVRISRPLLLLCFVGCFAGLRSASQPPAWRHEDLDRQYAEATSDTARLQILDLAAWRWLFSPRCLSYTDRSDSIVRLTLNTPDMLTAKQAAYWRARLEYVRGYYYKFRRELSAAVHHFRLSHVYSIEARDPYFAANGHDAMGVCFQALGMHDEALRYFTLELDAMLPIRPEQPEDLQRAQLHRAGALARLGRYQEADAQLDLVRPNKPSYTAFLHMQRADLALWRRDTANALIHMDSAMALLPTFDHAWDGIPVLEPTARTRLKAGLVEASLITAEKCIALATSTADEGAWCGCTLIAAEALLAQNRKRDAEEQLRAALERARGNGYVGLSREIGDDGSMVRAAEELKDLYKAQGRTAEALAMTEYWTLLKDSVAAIEARADLFRFELEQAAFTDSITDARNLQEATLSLRTTLETERANHQLAIVLGVGSAIVGLLVVLFLLNRRKQERLLAAHDMRRAQDEHMIRDLHMREQMSEDLHEELGAGLSALKLWSEMDLAEEGDPQRRQLLEKRGAMADELVASLRQIIWALNSPATTLKQLVDYLVDLAHLHCAQHGLQLQAEVAKEWPSLTLRPEQRRLPFLAVKETLTNTVKHAGAQRVELHITWDNALLIELRDDGKGTSGPPDKLPGNGLRTMARRITSLGGKVIFDGTNGMQVIIRVPLAGA